MRDMGCSSVLTRYLFGYFERVFITPFSYSRLDILSRVFTAGSCTGYRTVWVLADGHRSGEILTRARHVTAAVDVHCRRPHSSKRVVSGGGDRPGCEPQQITMRVFRITHS